MIKSRHLCFPGILLLCVIATVGCTSTPAPADIPRLREKLSENERMFAAALLGGFDLTEAGTVHVAMESKPASRDFLRYVNACSPVLRFANPGSDAQKTFGQTFNLEQAEHFYPGYVYLSIGYYRVWNGKGEYLGVVVKKDADWVVADGYTFENPWDRLDLAWYVKQKIESNPAPQPTPAN